MSPPSDAEVIGRSLGEPEAFGLIYDRHAATLLRFLGRRAGAKVAEGLVGELFRVAFERRKTFDASRSSALPWLYGIGSKLLLKHRRGEARRLRASARIAGRRTDGRALPRSRRACCSRAWPTRSRRCRTTNARRSCSSSGRSSRTTAWRKRSSCRSAPCARGSIAPARACANCSSQRGNIG